MPILGPAAAFLFRQTLRHSSKAFTPLKIRKKQAVQKHIKAAGKLARAKQRKTRAFDLVIKRRKEFNARPQKKGKTVQERIDIGKKRMDDDAAHYARSEKFKGRLKEAVGTASKDLDKTIVRIQRLNRALIGKKLAAKVAKSGGVAGALLVGSSSRKEKSPAKSKSADELLSGTKKKGKK